MLIILNDDLRCKDSLFVKLYLTILCVCMTLIRDPHRITHFRRQHDGPAGRAYASATVLGKFCGYV